MAYKLFLLLLLLLLRSNYCHRRTGYKEENHHLYGYSIARVQRTTIASSTIGDVNNYDVKRTTIGGVNNYSVVYSGTGRCQ